MSSLGTSHEGIVLFGLPPGRLDRSRTRHFRCGDELRGFRRERECVVRGGQLARRGPCRDALRPERQTGGVESGAYSVGGRQAGASGQAVAPEEADEAEAAVAAHETDNAEGAARGMVAPFLRGVAVSRQPLIRSRVATG